MEDKPKCIESFTPTFSLIHWSTLIDSSLTFIHPEIKQNSEDASTSKEPNSGVEVDVTNLSPQHIEKSDDTLAFIHNNLSQGNPQTKKGFEKMDEE